MSLGELIKALREAQNLNQDDLAALMGMSAGGGRVTIAYWETDKRKPNAQQLPKLAACLGVWPIDGDYTLRRFVIYSALSSFEADAGGLSTEVPT